MTMTADTVRPALAAAARRPLLPRLVRAEVLKLRRRRGLLALTAVLTIVPILLGYGAAAIAHLIDAKAHGAAGGVENMSSPLEILGLLGGVAALLVGVTAGAGDLNAGVFRELVVTGRSRRALFLARIPGGLIVLLPFIVTAWALTIASAFAFAGGLATPSLGDVVASGAYIVLVPTMIFLLALGTAALVGSRSAAITGLLAWQFLVSPLLLGAGFLGVFREGFLIAATERLRPSTIGEPTELPMSIGAAVITLVLWVALPLALGAWRTETRDA
jgi:hypothetical protein